MGEKKLMFCANSGLVLGANYLKGGVRNLVQTVRKQIAVDQLSDPDVSICEVAFILGYSDQSAFTHAFKKWTGKSPKAYTMGANRDMTDALQKIFHRPLLRPPPDTKRVT